MSKREPLKIAASFKDAVKALLATPPPPEGYAGPQAEGEEEGREEGGARLRDSTMPEDDWYGAIRSPAALQQPPLDDA